jgi:hypothetical protein
VVPAGLELRVEDTPPGVAPGELEQLFEPLFRADTARQRATGGSHVATVAAWAWRSAAPSCRRMAVRSAPGHRPGRPGRGGLPAVELNA